MHESIRRTVGKAGARIEAADGSTNGQSAEDILVRQVLVAFSEYEKKVIAQRTKHAMLRYQSRGKIMSKQHPYYGYREDPARPGYMVEDLAEQKTIRVMVKVWRDLEEANRQSFRELARELDHLGYPPRDAEEWHHKIIKRILGRVGVV